MPIAEWVLTIQKELSHIPHIEIHRNTLYQVLSPRKMVNLNDLLL